ncbi:MAG: S8 family serine peptidase, partial [Clostridia bacterium]|nr:S8 family serine peptidase [Clostridia bacterium]
MICRKCGTEIEPRDRLRDGSYRCPGCGRIVEAEADRPEPFDEDLDEGFEPDPPRRNGPKLPTKKYAGRAAKKPAPSPRRTERRQPARARKEPTPRRKKSPWPKLAALIALALAAVIAVLFIRGRSRLARMEAMAVGEGMDFQTIGDASELIDFDADAGMLYVNNELLIYANDAMSGDNIESIAQIYGAALDAQLADIGIYRLLFDASKSYEALTDIAEQLNDSPLIERAYVDTVSVLGGDLYPTDDWNGATWSVDVPRDENWGMEAIAAPGAWDHLDGMDVVSVGLIDSMPNMRHSDLDFFDSAVYFYNPKELRTTTNTYELPSHDHGTHVAGIMAAKWNNGGVSGVMGDRARLYYCTTCFEEGRTYYSDYATAYTYLLSLKGLIDAGVRVVNISQNTSRLTGFAASRGNAKAIDYLTQQAEIAGKGLARIIEERQRENKDDFVICVAAGNNNNLPYFKDDSAAYGYREPNEEGHRDPVEQFRLDLGIYDHGEAQAKYNNFLNLIEDEAVRSRIIVVGAVGIDRRSTKTGTRYSYTDFSNIGDRVDVAAPGEDIYSCLVEDYGNCSGTSMSTPHVSGVAGLLFAADPTLTGPEVKEIITSTATGTYSFSGGQCGLLNAQKAVEAALKVDYAKLPQVTHVPLTAIATSYAYSSTEPYELVARFEAAYNRMDIQGMLDCIDPTVMDVVLGVADMMGLDGDALMAFLPFASSIVTEYGGSVQWPTVSITPLNSSVDGTTGTVTLRMTVDAPGEGSATEEGTEDIVKKGGRWYFALDMGELGDLGGLAGAFGGGYDAAPVTVAPVVIEDPTSTP